MCWRKVIKISQWLTLERNNQTRGFGLLGKDLPEVRHQVKTEHLEESEHLDAVNDGAKPDGHTDV